LSSISLPWKAKSSEVLHGFRLKAIRWLFGLGLVMVAVGAVLFVACRMAAADQVANWRVAVAYFGVLGPILTGAALILGAVAVIAYRQIGALLQARWIAFMILCGAVVGTCLLTWGYSWLSHYMRITFADAEVRMFSAGEIYKAIQPGCPVVFAAYLLWPLQFAVVRDLIAMGGLVGFAATVAAFGIWWERKVAGRIQSRLGPMRVGGWHGWAQSPADGIKLVLKEDFVPAEGDPILFRLAPYLAFVPTIVAFTALPFAGAAWVFREMDVALIFILAVLGMDVLGVLCAGLASNNKYSTFGGLREACQMVSYEIPMSMSLLVPIMMAGTLNLSGIAEQQGGGFHSWFVFANPWCFIAFFMYYAASLASCKRAPFDLPEAESELVAGFLTEYSGLRWGLFFLGEYAAMFVVSGLAVILFLGGWKSPFPAGWAPTGNGFLDLLIRGLFFDGPILFILKSMFLFYVQLWIRWTLPRVRIDQVLYACVQVLLPIAMVVLLANTFWMLGLRQLHLEWLVWLDAALHAILVAVGYIAVATMIGIVVYGFVNRTRLVGRLAVKHLPGA
jgi:NADH-quinone oxidoreductase subunit H